MMKNKTVLITGAAGFLGSHLCDRFVTEGATVIAMDNLITGDEKNIEHLKGLPNFSFVLHDITKHITIDGPLDYILHFASPASPIDYLKIPIQTLKVGALGTHNCLGLAKDKGARILVASTSEVYGDPLVHPQPESYWGNVNPIGPRGVYDEAKLSILNPNTVDPDIFVMGGGMSNIEELYQDLPQKIAQYTFSPVFATPIVKSMHGDSSGVRGAAWLWRE